MSAPSIEVIKDCLRIKTSDENFLIKKHCILGYGEKGDNLYWYLTIYTNIPGAQKINMVFTAVLVKTGPYPAYTTSHEPNEIGKEEYRKCRKLLDSILSPEVEASGDLLALYADNVLKN